MIWYIAVDDKPEKATEEELIYRIKNNQIKSDALVVNAEKKEWIPLNETKIWTDNFMEPKDNIKASDVSVDRQSYAPNSAGADISGCSKPSDAADSVETSAHIAVRRICTSPYFLVPSVVFTLYAIFSLFNVFAADVFVYKTNVI